MLRAVLTVGTIAALPWCLASSSFVKQLFAPKPTHPLLLGTFKIYKSTQDDRWNKKPGTEFLCKILTEDDDPNAHASIKEIGHFQYRATVGQVCGIYLEPDYRGRLLREQVLIYMMRDMLDHGATNIWEWYPKKNEIMDEAHAYCGLWGFQYQDKAVHPSVSGTGYSMPIPADPRELVIKPR